MKCSFACHVLHASTIRLIVVLIHPTEQWQLWKETRPILPPCSCSRCNGYVPLRRTQACCNRWEAPCGPRGDPGAAVFDKNEKLQSARLYGNIYNYAYWFVDILVGTPQQRVSVIVDTGSAITAFACSLCENCGVHGARRCVFQDVHDCIMYRWFLLDFPPKGARLKLSGGCASFSPPGFTHG